ncbi:type III sulfide quinone reductase, selenoprotein subtype [Rhodohalobacter sulfatireducens]|uniref:NAD(P)/FAD-dependent oxidoreductase n=1 Tax=Rhodohalobacter sulfatireducens TaxID=2911366 RepID=A0ABS9KBX2_9BACT|nr:FAD/NAD(P)-binding oxidoreductase [Rhodohalobacter sulfatireducens]MCG2588333.1 NAD(P)/FAD-dependent oxidoreductase [Rhodohalobacter sulfatireducens]
MKDILILGAGTSGTMMANKLSKALKSDEFRLTIVDKDETHYYQPGFLFIPFGIYSKEDVIKPKKNFFPKDTNVIVSEIDLIKPEENKVHLSSGDVLSYDYLIIATGTEIRPDEIEGMTDELWKKSIFDFYTIEGALALAEFLDDWEGGKLVLNIAEMPIKCPVAPLEFLFLADDYFKKKGMRDKVEIIFVTPLDAAFTKPIAARELGNFLEEKNINLVTEFNIGRVDNEEKKIISWDEREVEFDLLVTIPTNMGIEAIEKSEMGDELNFIPTDNHTLQSENWENIFVIGDATNLPSSKAGSVAHFESDVLFENLLSHINGEPLTASFDGHANCFIESGDGKGLLIDFNYDTEPLPGKFPIPGIGPFSLLKETKMNHIGKMGFKWLYWNMLIKGRDLPLESQMSMAGKIVPEKEEQETKTLQL